MTEKFNLFLVFKDDISAKEVADSLQEILKNIRITHVNARVIVWEMDFSPAWNLAHNYSRAYHKDIVQISVRRLNDWEIKK